jgi:GTP pyrophosphokinase
MVSVSHSIAKPSTQQDTLELIAEGLPESDRERLVRAYALVEPLYRGRQLGSGESIWHHILGMALIAASLKLDVETRLAALLFAASEHLQDAPKRIAEDFGPHVALLVEGLNRLNGLRLVTRTRESATASEIKGQTETLRKMLLAMVEDIRVVLLRLVSRAQTLRYFTDHPGDERLNVARESLDIYAPLANRLGVWQLKWELEDLSFRFIEPETYKRIARQLDERRVEREQFISQAIDRLKRELAAVGVTAGVYGRPKHIYSIWSKMRAKHLDFSEVYDVRALRVIVDQVKDCYAALGVVHQIWQPIPKEFDDYIAHPKGNDYRSLHTAVIANDGRSLEVQIRTWDMHQHAELGVAAHWRYKESGAPADTAYDDKIALLRQLLSWRDEVTDAADWVEQFKRTALDDTIYVLTPQGRVIDLPRGATPVDFAYRVHTDLGHRCRGARVDGQLVTLNTTLRSGQRVEIVAAKQGGPSRDWLSPQQGYLATSHARTKVKRWFAALEEHETLSNGRATVMRELQREGQTQANIDALAAKLGYANADALFLAAGRGDLGLRSLQAVLRGTQAEADEAPPLVMRKSRAGDSGDGVLVVGMDKLLTQLGSCCKPAPPDAIRGFVTRGKGVSVHRAECLNFRNMMRRNPERVISAEWGGHAGDATGDRAPVYPADILVDSVDRQGLLRDISEVLSREKINVTAVNTLSRAGHARMRFTVEVTGVSQLDRTLKLVADVASVERVQRG